MDEVAAEDEGGDTGGDGGGVAMLQNHVFALFHVCSQCPCNDTGG